MKYSESWLREFVDPPINSHILAKQITMLGLTVESINPASNIFSDVVIGKIVKFLDYDNNKKIKIIKVDINKKKLIYIFSSLNIFYIGMKIVVAKVDNIFSVEKDINKTQLYKYITKYMCCCYADLGMNKLNNKKIIELPADAPIGCNIADYLNINDNIFDVNITSNRADCFSILGISREIAIRNRMQLLQPKIENNKPTINDKLSIRIDESALCPYYACRIINNINVNALTPIWMKEKLNRCGMPLTNVVNNIINYVLLELGQPLFVFDRELIKGSVVIRYAKINEIFNICNNKIIKLSPDTLVIADNEKVLALAGIINNFSSVITKNTRNIVLESSFFYPKAIIGRSTKYKLFTEFAKRYEHGIDYILLIKAMERTTTLLLSICQGQSGPKVEITNEILFNKPHYVVLTRKNINKLLGYFISNTDINDILYRLGCKVIYNNDRWKIFKPSWRIDMNIEEDFIREIARIHGYNLIPNTIISSNVGITINCKKTLPLLRAKTMLVDYGYQEIITYSFIDPKYQNVLHPKIFSLKISNPVSKEMSIMRLSLWSGLLKTVIYNEHRQQKKIRLFESGLCFFPDKRFTLGVRQNMMLSGVLAGARYDENWSQKYHTVDFYDAKGDIESILELTGKLDYFIFKRKKHPALHPGQSSAIYFKNKIIGWIGSIDPNIEKQLGLKGRTIVFELLWEKISSYKIPEVSNISCFPFNRRDISLIVSENITSSDIISECKKNILENLIKVYVFNIYKDDNIPNGFKYITISIILQSNTHTLKEENISKVIFKCVTALTKKFKACLRS